MQSGSIRVRSAARVRDCLFRSASPKRSTQKFARAWKPSESVRRWTKLSTSAQSSRPYNLNPSAKWSTPELPRALTAWQPSNHGAAKKAASIPPTLCLLTFISRVDSRAGKEIFGPVLVAMTFRTPARSRGAGQQHHLRPRRKPLEREHQRRSRPRLAGQSWSRLGQLRNQFGSRSLRSSTAIANRAAVAKAVAEGINHLRIPHAEVAAHAASSCRRKLLAPTPPKSTPPAKTKNPRRQSQLPPPTSTAL